MMVEIKSEQNIEKIEKEEQKIKERAGMTRITSVSVTEEFKELVKKYNLSPTEVFRRGVAVTLCDMGVAPYYNKLNAQRLEEAEEFLKEMRQEEKIKEKLIKLKKLLEDLNNF